MAPVAKEHTMGLEDIRGSDQSGGDRIVISGMSGEFPQSHNVKEFSDILYNKVNPVTLQDNRWDYQHPELPQYVGMAPALDGFDAQFFAVHHRLGQHLDPMSRKMLENTFEALYDAGLSPGHLYGQKVAVFMGTSFSATEKDGLINNVSTTGMGIMGTNKTMFANRISYWLNLKGPSVSIDEADCSSTSALEQAFLAIKRGVCEAAIVGGAHFCLHPQDFIHHGRLGAISQDGNTNSFADNCNGFTLSDAAGIFILQKSKDSLRCYAEVVHVKNEFVSVVKDEIGPKFGYYRDPQASAKFIEDFYKGTQITPQRVEYVEGCGTGIPDVDKSELEAIEEVYCKNREDTLLVGSVTSNIGVTEAASGVAAITKVLLSYHNGKIAANLNCETPRRDIAALQDGRMRIVTEHQPFHREYTAVNGLSVTGVNSHVLLKGHYKPKNLSQYKCSIPHLVLLSGRQESSVQNIIEDLKSRPVDHEEIALFHNIHSSNISGHLGRGYAILDTNEDKQTVSLSQKIEYYDDARRPLWFVYSGMGSQWAGMGAQLMRIPIFASAIERCDRVLKPKGLDIVKIISSPDKTMFDNILHAFVGIASMQIGLTDILRALQLIPDGIIGHSVGEMGCAYADGCITAEEMILAAWCRGQVSLQTKFVKGSMAAVGLGYEDISKLCPPEIDVACHNGPDSCTISGPADVMRSFVANLTSSGVFAKEVPCANIAYHSRYIKSAGPSLLKHLKEVIKSPKRRSKRWVSTSVPQDKWNEESAQYCSAEYQTNNLLSPVLFNETLQVIPSNAVLVEVAPHGLLQAILKRSLPADCRNLALTQRGHPDNTLHLLQAIGNLYVGGYSPNVQALYPKVQFPVSTETPMLSHQVEWVRTEKWNLSLFSRYNKKKMAACTFVKSIYDDEHSYLRGNVIRGKMCYPFAAALVAVWDTFAMNAGAAKRGVSVLFQDLHLYAQPLLLNQKALKLDIVLHRGTGRFEVTSECSLVMSGYVVDSNKKAPEFMDCYYQVKNDTTDMDVSSDDIYQLLKDRGYRYGDEFRSIDCADESFNQAAIVWQDNWVTFIDGMLQLNVLRQPHHAVVQPAHIEEIRIDVKHHIDQQVYNKSSRNVLKANIVGDCESTRCGGVFIRGITYRNLPVVRQSPQIELCVPSEVNNINSVDINERKATVNNKTLQSAHIGKLDSLQWVEIPQLKHSNINVKVHFAALNLLDVRRATGAAPCDTNMYGMDYSGTTHSGERVMGIVHGGAASSEVRAVPELLWPVPAHWSLEDAATVPLAYARAFYALAIKGRLKSGMCVLVHGGSGALGQAAIAVALAHNCEVFTTVSDIRKKRFIRKRFPQIKDEHIGNSRDVSFSATVLLATKGIGCDIVISCVTGELKELSEKCCGFFGRLIDIVHIKDCENFGMNFLELERSYIIMDFSSVFTQNKYEDMKVLQRMISDGISAGYVVPLSRVTYAPQDALRAFRLLSTSQHRGRVLLRMTEDTVQVQQRIICDSNKCQVMLWDSGTLAVQLTDRLIDRGATKFYIYSNKLTSYQRLKISSWQQLGIRIVVASEDLTKTKPEADILNDAKNLRSIEGIYAVLTNNSNTETHKNVLKNLDRMSKLSSELKYFAVVSTVKNVGQELCLSRAKHGAITTYLDISSLYKEELLDGLNVGDMVEQALCSSHVELVARPKYTGTPSLLEQLATIADINITQDTNTNVTLKELGVADEQARWINSYLDVTYNILLDDKTIPLLTVDKINEMQKSVMEIELPNVRGLATFYNHIGSDEIAATADLVLLPTLCTEVLSLDDFAIGERYIYIVPGMEGHHERFRELCERLKLPALVLQSGFDHQHETVQETAQRYTNILKKKAEVQDNFYILGYETGVIVALELAAILEEQGLTGTVFCLGLAPDELQEELEEQLSDLVTQEQLEDAVVRHMYTLLTGEDTTILDNTLQQADTWKLKVDTCVRHLLGRMSHTTQYARALMEAALASIQRLRCYSPKAYSLRSKLVMLRAASSSPQSSILKQCAQQPIVTHQLQSPLSYVLNDVQCPSLVNRYLDDDLKKAFDTQNLCHTYSSERVTKS